MKFIFLLIVVANSYCTAKANDTICTIEKNENFIASAYSVHKHKEFIYIHEEFSKNSESLFSLAIYNRYGKFLTRIDSQNSNRQKKRNTILRIDLFGFKEKEIILFCVLDNMEFTYSLDGRFLGKRKKVLSHDNINYFVPLMGKRLCFYDEDTYLLPVAQDLKDNWYEGYSMASVNSSSDEASFVKSSIWPDLRPYRGHMENSNAVTNESSCALPTDCSYVIGEALYVLDRFVFLNDCTNDVVVVKDDIQNIYSKDIDFKNKTDIRVLNKKYLLVIVNESINADSINKKTYVLDNELNLSYKFDLPENAYRVVDYNVETREILFVSSTKDHIYLVKQSVYLQ